VYTGGLTQLVNVTNCIDWHEEFREDLFMEIGKITLKEIAKQLTVGNAKVPLITVIVNNPRDTDVYQYGNYNDNSSKCGQDTLTSKVGEECPLHLTFFIKHTQ
jgi:hypothetical protein